MTVQELLRSIVNVVDTADFDVNKAANELGYKTGELMRHPGMPDCEAIDFEPKYRHDQITGMLRLSQRLHHLRFRGCGHGYFSSVFKHEDAPGVVFKLSMRTDDAYAAFALWSRNNPDKHAPVFHDIQRGRSAVVFAIKEYITLQHAIAIGALPSSFSTYSLMGRVYDNKSNTLYRRDLVKYIRSIKKFFRGVAAIDIHGENIMFDPDTKRVIVTDPVSFTKSSEEYSCS